MTRPNWFPGEMLAPQIPAHAKALEEGGTAWLTEAFRAAGALAPEGRVARITQFEERLGGGTGRKLLLGVEYAGPAEGLPTELFVKFSRDYDDDFRDSLRSQMEPEVRFALLSRAPDFPVAVARCMYADVDSASGTGVLITERIPYGRGGLEPAYEKCKDDELPDPVGHYGALLTAVARLAGAHKAGRIPASVAEHFPFDQRRLTFMDPIAYDAGQLQRRLQRFGEFAADFPRLIPAAIVAPDFLAQMAADIPRFLAHEAEIKVWLHADPRLIALCHWNANVDNGWFWRGKDGALHCGLLDWGGVNQMSVALAIYGALSGAEPEVWDDHLDDLLEVFARAYRDAGGPELAIAELKRHVLLMTAMMGLAWLMDAPAVVRREVPELAELESRFDPRLRENENARMRLHMITMFLNVWRRHQLGAVLDGFLRDR